MKLALTSQPAAAHVHAVAAVTLGHAVAGGLPVPPRRPSPDNRRASGCRPSRESLAAYLAVVAIGVPQAAAARALGRDRSQVHRALHRVETYRDEPGFDVALDAAAEEMIFA